MTSTSNDVFGVGTMKSLPHLECRVGFFDVLRDPLWQDIFFDQTMWPNNIFCLSIKAVTVANNLRPQRVENEGFAVKSTKCNNEELHVLVCILSMNFTCQSLIRSGSQYSIGNSFCAAVRRPRGNG